MKSKNGNPAILLLLVLPLLAGCSDTPTSPGEDAVPHAPAASSDLPWLSIVPRDLELAVGDSQQLTLVRWQWHPDGVMRVEVSDPTIRWVTEDDQIATVSQDGMLRAVGKGDTEIRALNGEKYSWARVKVR